MEAELRGADTSDPPDFVNATLTPAHLAHVQSVRNIAQPGNMLFAEGVGAFDIYVGDDLAEQVLAVAIL